MSYIVSNEDVHRTAFVLDGFGAETWFDKYYRRADVTSLLGDLAGLRVLDAGCGYGADSCALESSGAHVTGLDIDRTALEFARAKKCSDSTSFIEADLRFDIPLADETHDGVLASLVLHYLEDWNVPLQSFFRVLKPKGHLVISVHHPAADAKEALSKDYFSRESWEGIDDFGHRHVFWRRPLENMVSAVQERGFTIEKLIEPKPNRYALYNSQPQYEDLISTPRYIALSAIKH
jgi:ubiquinone/menaquinone biosynthesis C-methylase UbiE